MRELRSFEGEREMRRFAWLVLVGTAAVAAVSLPTTRPAAAGAGGETNLVVSNFRYCPQAPCEAGDYAYLRSPAGPISGTDNTAAFVDVAPGEFVTWKYADELCDATQCPGHEVRLENGDKGLTVGSMEARPGESITWTIPADAKPGTVLRYFCDVQTHWKEGLTGAFRIVGS
jgi:plastocyanin